MKIQEELKRIINDKLIETVFQPIISLKDGQLLGHEALSRITGITDTSQIKGTEQLFKLADSYNCLWELEQLCRTKAFEAAYKFMIPPYSKKLFINVNPNILHDEKFQSGFTKEHLQQYEISPENIIFEITERNVIKDIKSFSAVVNHYRLQDYKIAIDDAGAGYSGLNLISDVNPNYIKLDMKLIRNVQNDSLKASLVKGMVELSRTSQISIIAEGIEMEEELERLIELGVHYGQGYYIQKPDKIVKEIKMDILDKINEKNQERKNYYINSSLHMPVKSLCTSIKTFEPGKLVLDVYEDIKTVSNCVGGCVIKEERPVGIITKGSLALKLSGQYGFALYQNKPISHIMDKEFLFVDSNTPIDQVSNMAMSRVEDKLYDFIVVTTSGKYLGIVTIKDLLRKTTEIEVAAAKHQNPLTGLPGNIIIEEKLKDCLKDFQEYTVAYLDIDNFKAYNDVYGFENGDLVIKLLGQIAIKSVERNGFVGHIGGDDFVIIMEGHKEEEHFDEISKEFEREVLNYYNQEDLSRGYISSINRKNVVEKFPITTLTIVSVNNKKQKFKDAFTLTETLASLKKLKKINK